MKQAVLLMAVLVLFLLAGVIPTRGDHQAMVFRSPVFIVLLGMLCTSIVTCCRRMKIKWRTLGFLACHLGIVVILAGAFVGYIWGKRTSVSIPITQHHDVAELPVHEGEPLKLGFKIAVTNFAVQYYPPQYHLFRPETNVVDGTEQVDYELVQTVRVPKNNDELEFGEYGTLSVTNLCYPDRDGEWIPQYVLPNSCILQRDRPTARHFEADLRITDGADPPVSYRLEVNHPVSHAGWRFYLMSYDQMANRYVVLSARNDPGRGIVIAGIWLVIVGTAVVCFRRRKGYVDGRTDTGERLSRAVQNGSGDPFSEIPGAEDGPPGEES